MKFLYIVIVLTVSRVNSFNLTDLMVKQKILDNFPQSNCTKHLKLIFESAKQNEEWALKMLDSWGGLPSGQYSGNVINYGHFDQCTAIKTDDFRPLYCLIPINEVGKKYELQTSVCVPDSCSTKSIQDFMKISLKTINYQSKSPIECLDSRGFEDFGGFEYIFLTVAGVILLLVTTSTLYHVLKSPRNSKTAFTAFSLVRNLPKLMETNNNDKKNQLNCLNGLRAIAMMCIVVMHMFFFLTDFVKSKYNENHFQQLRSSFGVLTLIQAQLGADTFFILSGLCVTNGFMTAREKGEKFSLTKFYLHRFIRLTPTKIFAIIFAIFISNIQPGPVFNGKYWLANDGEACKKWWWSTVLYSQNYINPANLCLSATWYLNVDVHMFVISPLILLPLWKFGLKKVLAVLIVIMAISNLYVLKMATIYEFDFINMDEKLFFDKIYGKTHTRLSTWLFGLILGYVIHHKKNIPNQSTNVLNSVLMISLIILTFFEKISLWLLFDLNSNVAFTSIMHPLHRLVWGGVNCLIIYNCARGRGGAVNWFLSLSIWKPISRLNYSIFLVHVPLIQLTARIMRRELQFHGFILFQMGLGNYLMALLLAIPVTLFIEMPFINLESDWKTRSKVKEKFEKDQ